MPIINRNGGQVSISWNLLATYAANAGMDLHTFLHRYSPSGENLNFVPAPTPQATNGTIGGATIVNTNPFNIPHQWQEIPMPDMAGLFDTPKATRKIVRRSESASGSTQLLQELYKYKSMTLRKTDSVAFEKGNKVSGTSFDWCTQQGMVGIEIEVENIKQQFPIYAYWDAKTDGSLRNNGIEYVSVPLQIKQVQLALEHIYKQMNEYNEPDFSNRTSIHIHVNCRDLTQDQIFNFCILYALFEKHFYQVAGTRRMNSIFCVPLFRTNQLSTLNSVIYGMGSDWNKYCGLNLLPLFANNVTQGYGTVEFRHLYGTKDINEILMWINDIMCLRKFACEISKDDLLVAVKEMNTTSSYMSMYSQVFAKGRRILSNKKDFEECVSNIKRELFGNDYAITLNKTDQSKYWKLANELGVRG